jgi:hypothetical protein
MFWKKFSWQVALLVGALSVVACGGECGDGTVDTPNKDGVDETCDDGNLVPDDGCDGLCQIELPDEICDNGADDDGDGLIDCADVANCGNVAACVANSCGFNDVTGLEVDPDAVQDVTLVEGTPEVITATTADGLAGTIDGSCQIAFGGAGGLDIVFALDLPSGGNIIADLVSPGDDNPGVDNGIIIHDACGTINVLPPDNGELACGDVDFNAGETETASAAIQAAGTVFLIVGALTAGSEGNFTLTINFAGFVTEDNDVVCVNGVDDDGDGILDCADPDCAAIVACIENLNCTDLIDNDGDVEADCQDADCRAVGATCVDGTTACTPDANNEDAVGCAAQAGLCSDNTTACTAATGAVDCAGVAGTCADGATACTVATQAVDCGGQTGLCEDGTTACTVATGAVDCAGIGGGACDADGACTADLGCTVDVGCIAVCTPGANPPGDPCVSNNDCAATNGDPFCLDEIVGGFPGGYCSEGCVVDADCPAGSSCFFQDSVTNGGLCLDLCDPANGDADCREAEGYTCQNGGNDDAGNPVSACF